jgi:hypothetical protein
MGSIWPADGAILRALVVAIVAVDARKAVK